MKESRGFASMGVDRQRELASKGGKAAHAQGVGHEFTTEEAREAGRKGGTKLAQRPGYMAALGRKGGLARHRAKQEKKVG